jgi:preprotein translocase subunit SecD
MEMVRRARLLAQRWLRQAQLALTVLAVALIQVASFNPSNPLSTASARAEFAAVVGGRLILGVDLQRASHQEQLLERVRKTIANRLKSATGHTVLVQEKGSRLVVDLPEAAWERLLRIKSGLNGLRSLFVTGRLELTMVDDEDATLARLSGLPPGIGLEWDRYLGPKDVTVTAPYATSSDAQALLAFVGDLGRPGRVLAVSVKPDAKGKYRTYLLDDPAPLTGDGVAEAHVSFRRGEDWPNVTVSFTEGVAQSLDTLTSNNRFRRLAIVLDGRVVAAPIITAPIRGGICEIELWFKRPTAEALNEASDLSAILTSGPLAAPVRLISAEPLSGR